jgi:hypothetical protein
MSEFESIEAIKQVKYRYMRTLDTKQWDAFAATLTEDITADYGASIGEELRFTDRAALVDYMRFALRASVISEHRVNHPEITLDGPGAASGIWYLQDRVINPDDDFMLIGAAFYHDRYRRADDGWRISATGYERTYAAVIPLSDMARLAVTPGNALHI